MREIEFRGKAKHNDEWVYGFYSPLIWYPSLEQTPSIKTFKGSDTEINPETVGQYTGLKDKNGKKIFEGDIVMADFDYTEQPMEVIYYKCGFKLKSKDCKETYDYSIHDETPELEVIGNIYDNPELLKE